MKRFLSLIVIVVPDRGVQFTVIGDLTTHLKRLLYTRFVYFQSVIRLVFAQLCPHTEWDLNVVVLLTCWVGPA